jgi:hypothetical protein
VVEPHMRYEDISANCNGPWAPELPSSRPGLLLLLGVDAASAPVRAALQCQEPDEKALAVLAYDNLRPAGRCQTQQPPSDANRLLISIEARSC